MWTYPKCSVCGRPMVGKQKGTHLTCAPDYVPWRPTWTLNPPITEFPCLICGGAINAAHNITIHPDCLSGRRTAS